MDKIKVLDYKTFLLRLLEHTEKQMEALEKMLPELEKGASWEKARGYEAINEAFLKNIDKLWDYRGSLSDIQLHKLIEMQETKDARELLDRIHNERINEGASLFKAGESEIKECDSSDVFGDIELKKGE